MGNQRKVRYKIFVTCETYFNMFYRLTTYQRRQLEGCLCRVPKHFYNDVWDVITRTPHGIRVMGNLIPQQPTLSNMTKSEITFSLLVEEVLFFYQY